MEGREESWGRRKYQRKKREGRRRERREDWITARKIKVKGRQVRE